MSELIPEKKPKQRLAAGEPAAQAYDTRPLALRICFRCGTCAGTHTAARRGGGGPDLKLQPRKRSDSENMKKVSGLVK